MLKSLRWLSFRGSSLQGFAVGLYHLTFLTLNFAKGKAPMAPLGHFLPSWTDFPSHMQWCSTQRFKDRPALSVEQEGVISFRQEMEKYLTSKLLFGEVEICFAFSCGHIQVIWCLFKPIVVSIKTHLRQIIDKLLPLQ